VPGTAASATCPRCVPTKAGEHRHAGLRRRLPQGLPSLPREPCRLLGGRHRHVPAQQLRQPGLLKPSSGSPRGSQPAGRSARTPGVSRQTPTRHRWVGPATPLTGAATKAHRRWTRTGAGSRVSANHPPRVHCPVHGHDAVNMSVALQARASEQPPRGGTCQLIGGVTSAGSNPGQGTGATQQGHARGTARAREGTAGAGPGTSVVRELEGGSKPPGGLLPAPGCPAGSIVKHTLTG
jgi:hypothetical protein